MFFKKNEEKKEKKALKKEKKIIKKEMKINKKELKRAERKHRIIDRKFSIERSSYEEKEKKRRGSKIILTHLEGFPGFYPASSIKIERGKDSQVIMVSNRPYKVIEYKFGYRKLTEKKISEMIIGMPADGMVLDTLISTDLPDKPQESVLGLCLMNKDDLSFTPIFKCSRVEYEAFKLLIP